MSDKKLKKKLINHLNSEYKKSSEGIVEIYRSDLEELKTTEEKLIQLINILHTEGIINRTFTSSHNDLSMPCKITVLDGCLKYYKNNKREKIKSRREWIGLYLPLTISIISLIKSFMPEITLLAKQLMQLLK